MTPFLDESFLLRTETARRLYHEFAAPMPIIDYHNHLPPDYIAANHRFSNLTDAWLAGDHYKWRAMRANGIAEQFCTGNGTDIEKFMYWAQTVPNTLRNPLYHWTHLELQRYFGIQDLLGPDTAEGIYARANEQLATPAFSVRGLLKRMNVQVLCTTDDPTDSLAYHQQIQTDGLPIRVLPTFRPDKAMAVDNPAVFLAFLEKLEAATNRSIDTYTELLMALQDRHDFFGSVGCRVADHGLDRLYADDFTEAEVASSFQKIRAGKALTATEITGFKSAVLLELARMNHQKGWVQQFHLGALRNNNSRMLRQLGPDTGWDSIGDQEQGRSLSRFLDRLDTDNRLAKTILYNLNPRDNELFATMTGNFNDGTVAGKVQFGSGWWFLDQKDGMERQLNALSNMGLLSRFVGMLTDSRSFLSFPRHEYFRRILCNLLGTEIEQGELPNDLNLVGTMVQNICYQNAKTYFEL